MGIRDKFGKLRSLLNLRVMYVLGVIIAVLVLVDLSVFRFGFYGSILSPVKMYVVENNVYSLNGSALENANGDHGLVKDNVNGNVFDRVGFNREDEGKERDRVVLLLGKGNNGTSFAIEEDTELHNNFKSEEGHVSSSQVKDGEIDEDLVEDYDEKVDAKPNTKSTGVETNKQSSHVSLQLMSSESLPSNSEYVVTDFGTIYSYNMSGKSSIHHHRHDRETNPESINLQSLPVETADSLLTHTADVKKQGKTVSISQMNSKLLQDSAASIPEKQRRSSARDRELEKARVEIVNAPIVRDVSQVYESAFRNLSMFSRSYQLMEQLLKVYVYREGEKPIFHQPHMRGIYASEGWFMKLMEANRKFVVKDAKKAHLFYLPFSSRNLRSALNSTSFSSHKDLHLDNYVGLISKKYRFWNRTMGADHFLVACHDWAPRFTRNKMGHCIRALCNANVAKDFMIRKDVSLPVTYVRSSEHPLEYVGGSPPSKRHILTFFAGGMHGYLRPILLKYWSDKEPDMKIFGPLPRDVEGKAKYREFMKTSRYCICAKGYEVHTPRVVESIYFGCVPVIISDNYVPPFFEILDWEAFSVFILEKDIPNLRTILLSISEEKYITMHQRLKSVQHHFLWHKKPLKYDLFHMILHSVWYNRVFQIKNG